MPAGEVALLLVPAVLATVATVYAATVGRKTSHASLRIDDVKTAFDVLNGTVAVLNGEVRDQRERTEECERAKKELAGVVGQQAAEITNLKRSVAELAERRP